MSNDAKGADTIRQDLALLGSKKDNQETLDLIQQGFMESPLADCRTQRTKAMALYRLLKQLL